MIPWDFKVKSKAKKAIQSNGRFENTCIMNSLKDCLTEKFLYYLRKF